jgi:hypothetical protein
VQEEEGAKGRSRWPCRSVSRSDAVDGGGAPVESPVPAWRPASRSRPPHYGPVIFFGGGDMDRLRLWLRQDEGLLRGARMVKFFLEVICRSYLRGKDRAFWAHKASSIFVVALWVCGVARMGRPSSSIIL